MPIAASGVIGGDLSPHLSPEAWYVLDSVRYTTDLSGHGHNLSGAYSAIAGPSPGLVAGNLVGLQESSPSPIWRTAGPITVMALVSIQSSVGDRWLASCEISGGYYTWWKFGIGSDGRACYGVNNLVSSEFYQWGPVLPTDQSWHTFVFQRSENGRNVAVYLDGIIAAEGAAAMFPIGGSSAVLTIGKDYFAPQRTYRQQCTALWTRVLSTSEVRELARRVQGN